MSKLTNEEDRSERYERLSNKWFELAVEAAQVEGLNQPFETLTNLANTTENAWLSKGETVAFTAIFRDWADFCTAVADQEGFEFRWP